MKYKKAFFKTVLLCVAEASNAWFVVDKNKRDSIFTKPDSQQSLSSRIDFTIPAESILSTIDPGPEDVESQTITMLSFK